MYYFKKIRHKISLYKIDNVKIYYGNVYLEIKYKKKIFDSKDRDLSGNTGEVKSKYIFIKLRDVIKSIFK